MVLLLVSAGISLTATAVSWWNGRRTAGVEAQIESLQALHEELHAADAAARSRMLGTYLKQLGGLIGCELDMRYAVEADLSACLNKARSIRKKRFGAIEGVTIQRVTLELELALSRAKAERVYLEAMRQAIAASDPALFAEIPSPAALQLPNDFPRDGAFVHFDTAVPASLHGYRLRTVDWSESGSGRGVLVNVDHGRRVASLSASLRPLLEANLSDGMEPLKARVLFRDADGVHLEANGVPLLLPVNTRTPAEWLTPESDAEVYPEIWTLDEICKAGDDRPLHVRLNPRVNGNRTRWTSIRLAVAEAQLDELGDAFHALNALPESDPPWRLHMLPSGRLAFSMGPVTLETEPSLELMAFELKVIQLHSKAPSMSVRAHAELCAFIPGSEDDNADERAQFTAFLNAIHDEFDSQRSQMLQRHTALRLRKLSLIYQDQEDHLRGTGSTGIVVSNVESGGRVVTALLVGTAIPVWVRAAIQAPANHRMRACNSQSAWDVRKAIWLDQRIGLVRLELAVPETASRKEIDPLRIHRLELANEGTQQQILSRALERTIMGRFASAGVHATLLGLSGDPIPNETLGGEAVEGLLATDASVIAIWGPPGTGKTTTLVKWLLSIFPQTQEAAWPTILITAPTHVAVTKLLADLLKKAQWLATESVRYCGKDRIQGSGLEEVWHQKLLAELDPKQRGHAVDRGPAQRWAQVLFTREGREAAARWLLGTRHVHTATCAGMARRDYGLWERQFDIAIIDEAGKAFGAELMIPCSVARRVGMVGDHNQLPPTVTSDSLDPSIGYRLPYEEVQNLLERNTFQDIFEQLPVDKKGMLTEQHRMHADIGSLVSQLFYEGKLTSARHGGEWSLTRRRVMFLDFSGVPAYRHRRAPSSDSQENPTERAALHALLDRLSRGNDDQVNNALIICPYEAQRMAVSQEISDKRYSFKIEATTVDAVQGGEADLVILLMTRSHGRVQFLLDRHRLNVALSRAREAAIVLGHRRCLTREPGSPIEQLIRIGLHERTLACVSAIPKDQRWQQLAKSVSGCAADTR